MCGALPVLDRILGAWLMPFELKVSGSSQQQTSVQRPASVAESGKRSFRAPPVDLVRTAMAAQLKVASLLA